MIFRVQTDVCVIWGGGIILTATNVISSLIGLYFCIRLDHIHFLLVFLFCKEV